MLRCLFGHMMYGYSYTAARRPARCRDRVPGELNPRSHIQALTMRIGESFAPSARPLIGAMQRLATKARQRRETWLVSALAFVVVAYYVRNFLLRLGDPDLWGRMAVGELVLQARGMPRTDPFAYTPTLPLWVDHEWLTGLVFYGLYSAWGDAGILVTKTAIGLLTVLFACLAARLNGARLMPMLVLLVVAMPVFGYGMMPRAQVFTYFLFALWLYLLESVRHGQSAWRLTLLVPTMLLWANLHGGFLAGLGLLTLYLGNALLTRRAVAAIALTWCGCVAVTLVNPYGVDYWRYLIPAVSMHRPNVAEWAGVPFSWRYWNFWGLAGLCATSLWIWRGQWRTQLIPLLVMGGTLFLAARHARHMPFFAIAVCSFLPAAWCAVARSAQAVRARLSLADAIVILSLLAVGAVQARGIWADGPLRFELPTDATGIENMVVYPVHAVDAAVEQRLRGNLAVPFNWGEYAIWRLYPDCRVSLDGRYETVYPDATVGMVDRFFTADTDWHDLIDRHATDLVLAPSDSPVNAKLRERGWSLHHADPTATLWSRP